MKKPPNTGWFYFKIYATDVGKMAQGLFQAWAVPIPEGLARQIPGQLSIWGRPHLGELQPPTIQN